MSLEMILERFVVGIGLVLVAGIVVAIVIEIPGLGRYLHIMSLAKRSSMRSNLVKTKGPSYAQGPRRSGEADEHRGHARRASKASAHGGGSGNPVGHAG